MMDITEHVAARALVDWLIDSAGIDIPSVEVDGDRDEVAEMMTRFARDWDLERPAD